MSLTLETLQQTRTNIGLVNFTNFLRSLSSEPDERVYQARYTVFKILQQGSPRIENSAIKRRTTFQRAITPVSAPPTITTRQTSPTVATTTIKTPNVTATTVKTPNATTTQVNTPGSIQADGAAAPSIRPGPIVETRVGVKNLSEARILSPEVVIGAAINVGSLFFYLMD